MLSFMDRSRNHKPGGETDTDGRSTSIEIFIPRDTRVTGSIETKHKMRLEGQVYGPITASGVVIEAEATVEGEINAINVTILGRLKGMLRAKHVHLHASGDVDGDMAISSMVVEEGGRCLGNIKQEKYGVAKPVIKRVVTIDDDYGQLPGDGDENSTRRT